MRCLLLALALFVAAPIAGYAQESTPGPFTNGFGQLSDLLGDQTGTPLTSEFPNPSNGDTLQITSTGLMYWSEQHSPTWTNGWLHVALGPNDQLLRWSSEDVDPPHPPDLTVASSATGIVFGLSPREYLYASYPALAPRIDCIITMESRWTPSARNPLPWGRFGEHASGLAQFLPSTMVSLGHPASWVWDAYRSIDATAEMFARGRAREFAGVAWGRC